MKYYLRKNTEDGAAIVITLLIVVLLTTISASFFSTARIEQTATRNYTAKTQAEQFAILATQQAMAKIQKGFTASGTGTTVITTQPGAVRQFVFQNGNITSNTTINLFSGSGNATISGRANLNNLQNPGNPSSSATDNQWTITGNATETINVSLEEITDTAGNLAGRIAFYVDDELTKININAAMDNRTTLNVSSPRHLSLSAFTTSNLTTFRSVIDGTMSFNNSSINNWGHFFRNEQTARATDFNGKQMSNISSAPLSDFHLKFTPWGARRLHVNDETLNSTGVENIYSALSSQHLKNIYGQSFNDKYGQPWSWSGNKSGVSTTTANGLKQIAANILQMRRSAWTTTNAGGFKFTDALIKENSSTEFPLTGYHSFAYSTCLNEFAFKMDYQEAGSLGLFVFPKPTIEFFPPFSAYFSNGNPYATLEFTIIRIDFTVQDSLGTTINCTKGPLTINRSFEMSNVSKYLTYGYGHPPWQMIPLVLQINVFNNGNTPGLTANNNLPWRIIGNPTVVMGDVKIFAGNSTSASALRDWLPGSFINSSLPHATVGGNNALLLNTPLLTTNSTDTNNFQANFCNNLSLQRVDPRIRGETAWKVAPHTFCRNGTTILSLKGNNESYLEEQGHNTFYKIYGLTPSETSNRDIPGDPSPLGNVNEPDYFIANEHSWVFFADKLQTFDSSGNATFNTPNDLGKVATNVNWRRLRFMPRHQNENAKNLIPDWAMLDVISFSSNNSSSSILKIAPINPNGSFAVDSTLNNSTISPRNNIPVLIKALESTTTANFQIGSAIARSSPAGNMTFDKVDMSFGGDLNTFRGNATMATVLSNNIANTTWSTQNGTWNAWRGIRGWPYTSLVLPGEITEISGVADYGRRSQYDYTTYLGKSIKENEGRLSAFFPGLTLQSNFFTIYAYAQAFDKQGNIDSEALTKSLIEVEITTPATATTPAQYKVRKLYTQPIPLGQ